MGPILSIAEESLATTIMSGQTKHITLTLSNDGQSPLDYQVKPILPHEPVHILKIGKENEMLFEDVTNQISNYTLTSISYYQVNDALFSEKLSHCQILLLFPEIDIIFESFQISGWYYQFGKRFKTLLTDYVFNGGIIILCASDDNEHELLNGSDLLPIQFDNYASKIESIVMDPLHPLTSDLSLDHTFSVHSVLYNLIDTEANSIITLNGKTALSIKKLGLGEVMLIGFYYDEFAAQVMSNAIKYYQTKNWMAVLSAQSSIKPGESAQVSVSVNAQYFTYIVQIRQRKLRLILKT